MSETESSPHPANLPHQHPRIPKREGSSDLELEVMSTHRRRRLYGSSPPSLPADDATPTGSPDVLHVPEIATDTDTDIAASDSSGQSDDSAGSDSDHTQTFRAILDPGDHVFRCPICLWEVSEETCDGCGKHVQCWPDEDGSEGAVSPQNTITVTDLNTKLSVFEFNSIPAITFHETPDVCDIPPAVIALSQLMSTASDGCESIPESLRPILEPRLRMETIPRFAWLTQADQSPEANLKLWERVQSIVDLSDELRNTHAEEAAYVSFAQKILEGTKMTE